MVCSLEVRFVIWVGLLLCDFAIFADFWFESRCILGVFGCEFSVWLFGLVFVELWVAFCFVYLLVFRIDCSFVFVGL